MEIVDHVPPVSDVASSIKSKESVFSKIHEIFKNIKHLSHLAEDQYFISISFLLLQNKIKFLQFRRISNETAKVNNLDMSQGRSFCQESLPFIKFLPFLEISRVFTFHDEFLEFIVVEKRKVLIEST